VSSFVVSPDSLRDLASRLETIQTDLASTGAVIGGYAGQLGAPQIDSALDDFFSNWSDGMDEIKGHLDGAVTRLRAAADAYQGTDDDIATAATPNNATA
jgi:uncharacterized protein YukE